MGRLLLGAATLAAAFASSFAASTPSTAADKSPLASALAQLDPVADIRSHQQQLQAIADANNGTRASGTPGFDQSANYVANALEDAGYIVTRQQFEFPYFEELADPEFERVSPNPVVYTPNDVAGFFTLQYSGSGEVTAEVQAIDVTLPPTPVPSSTSGCEPEDFTGFTPGRIALIQRGTCTFQLKTENAVAAGAVGVIIFNEGQPGRTEAFTGTLGAPMAVPVIGISFATGQEFYDLSQTQPVTARVKVTALSEFRMTENVFGESRFGSNRNVVVVGAHLDSVTEGPGINDNGSGTAVILNIAEKLAALRLFPLNKLRFAFWGAEEPGLLGSIHYVENLTEQQRSRIMLNLNFDMLGSPNYVRFVYDGDGSDTPDAGPPGSDRIEQVFEGYFDFRHLQTEPTAFDGRSDYGPFIDVGIPAGGLFSGAEGIKTVEEAQIYGGTADVAYDFCYHQACDTFDNVNEKGLKELAQAAAFSVLWWSFDRLPPRPAMAEMVALQATSPSALREYRGRYLQK
jgi:aminopeptidase Y